MRTKMGFGIAVLGVIVLLASFVSLIYGLTHSHAEASVTSKQGEYVVTDAGRAEAVEPADGEGTAVRNAGNRILRGDELCHWRSPAVTW